MAILSKSGFYGAIESVKATGAKVFNRLGALVPEFASTFVSGFAGKGWAIRNTASEGENWEAEFDSLTIRKTMTVFELLISRIRAVNGGLVISQANGKVKSVRKEERPTETQYYLRLEDEVCEFVVHDLIRMQVFRNNSQRYYHLEVLDVITHTEGDETYHELKVKLPFSSIMSEPQVGDEIVQFGNKTDPNRQSAIYLHADGTHEASIDLLDGISSASALSDIASGWVVMRIGGDLPNTEGKNGFYCKDGTIFSENNNGMKMYELNPNGSGQLAHNKISWDEFGNISLSQDVKITWDNLPEDAQSELTPQIQYSDNGNDWRPNYVSGDTWMRVGFPPTNWQTMRLSQSGDNAYVHIRYGYEQASSNPNIAPMLVMLPINPTSAQMAQATHLGVRTDNNPNYPSMDFAGNYSWSRIKGEDANLLDWVQDWNGSTTEIGGNHIISPKMFSGTKDANTGALTGIAMGRGVIGYDWVDDIPVYNVNATPSDGIVGIKNNEIYLAINFEGDNYFRGAIYADKGNIAGFNINAEGLRRTYSVEDRFEHTIRLENSYISFTDTNGSKAVLGLGVGLPYDDMVGIDTIAILKSTYPSVDKALLCVEASGCAETLTSHPYANTAINIQGGYIQGIRMALQRLNNNNRDIRKGVNLVIYEGSRGQINLPPMSGTQDDGYILRVVNKGLGELSIKADSIAIPISVPLQEGVEMVWIYEMYNSNYGGRWLITNRIK